MGRQLTETKVDFISLVKKGANGEQVTIYKSADYSPETAATETAATETAVTETPAATVQKTEEAPDEMKGFFKVLKDFFGGGKKETDVSKSQDLPSPDYASFSSRINNQRMKVRDAVYILEDTMYSIFWDDSLENGKELLLKNIEEFKDYISKVLSEAVEVQKEAFEKSQNEEELEVKKEDLMVVLKEALGPISQSVTDLAAKVEKMEKPADAVAEVAPAGETKVEAAATDTAVAKSEELTVEVVKSLLGEVLAPVSKSITELGARVETVEQARGISKSLESTSIQKSDTEWGGLLPFIPGATN